MTAEGSPDQGRDVNGNVAGTEARRNAAGVGMEDDWLEPSFAAASRANVEALKRYPGDIGLASGRRILTLAEDVARDLNRANVSVPRLVHPQLSIVRALTHEIQNSLTRLLKPEVPPSVVRQASDEVVRAARELTLRLARVLKEVATSQGMSVSDRVLMNGYANALEAEGARMDPSQSAAGTEQTGGIDDTVQEDESAGTGAIGPADARAIGRMGSSPETQLAVHFGQYALKQGEAADRLRWYTIGIVVLIALIAGGLAALHSLEDTGASDGERVAQLAVTLPLAGLAAYLAREAGRHRDAARWASVVEVQLLSVESYTTTLPSAHGDQIRLELGRRVFSGYAERGDASPAGPSVVSETAGLLEQAAKVMGSAGRKE